jgi:hypothetical protein
MASPQWGHSFNFDESSIHVTEAFIEEGYSSLAKEKE